MAQWLVTNPDYCAEGPRFDLEPGLLYYSFKKRLVLFSCIGFGEIIIKFNSVG